MIDYSNIDRVLDESTRARWQALADNESYVAWAYGDLLNQTYAIVKANALPFTKQDVAVWSCIVTGTDRAPRTLLYYAEVSLFYAPEIREAYDPLPFVHFRYAMSQKDHWREVLEYSLDYLGRFGKPPSRKKLRRTFEGIDEDGETLEKALESLHADIPDQPYINILPDMPEKVYDDEIPQDVYSEVGALLSRLHALLPRLSNGREPNQVVTLIAQVVSLVERILNQDRAA